MGRLDGKACVETGAGSGIGRATAHKLAEEGGRVVCVDIDGAEAEATVAAGSVVLADGGMTAQ